MKFIWHASPDGIGVIMSHVMKERNKQLVFMHDIHTKLQGGESTKREALNVICRIIHVNQYNISNCQRLMSTFNPQKGGSTYRGCIGNSSLESTDIK